MWTPMEKHDINILLLLLVYYKWHLFKILQKYHRAHLLTSDTWCYFITTYPSTMVGCNTCRRDVTITQKKQKERLCIGISVSFCY